MSKTPKKIIEIPKNQNLYITAIKIYKQRANIIGHEPRTISVLRIHTDANSIPQLYYANDYARKVLHARGLLEHVENQKNPLNLIDMKTTTGLPQQIYYADNVGDVFEPFIKLQAYPHDIYGIAFATQETNPKNDEDEIKNELIANKKFENITKEINEIKINAPSAILLDEKHPRFNELNTVKILEVTRLESIPPNTTLKITGGIFREYRKQKRFLFLTDYNENTAPILSSYFFEQVTEQITPDKTNAILTTLKLGTTPQKTKAMRIAFKCV